MTNMQASIGIFGGTFDPVHQGHITLALELKHHLQLNEMRLIPCRLPPHRAIPSASDADRLQMLKLATAKTTLRVDDRELQRDGPSYTFDTLQSLRHDYGADRPMVLCMGMDVFALLTTWHHWQNILELAHIAVVSRADFTESLGKNMSDFLNRHQTKTRDELTRRPGGKIYLTQLSQIPVSSTTIREVLAKNVRQTIPALDPDVQAFIQQKGLYQQ